MTIKLQKQQDAFGFETVALHARKSVSLKSQFLFEIDQRDALSKARRFRKTDFSTNLQKRLANISSRINWLGLIARRLDGLSSIETKTSKKRDIKGHIRVYARLTSDKASLRLALSSGLPS